ncbi:MAG: tetratricopeptide repeat protein [Bacteriovoracaceae bacterium]
MLSVLFVNLFLVTNLFAGELSPILTLLDKEMSAITRMKDQKKTKVHHLHRLLELYAEKCKYIREEENKAFFEAMKKNELKDKSHYYGNTKVLYDESLKIGKELIKTYPDYQSLGEVYYTMALNSRDYGSDKLAESFFLKSLQFMNEKHPLRLQVEASLGDYYYNQKTYDKAKKIYEIVLQHKNNEWWGKYAYNYAWCLLKLEHNQKALSVMLEAYQEGKKKSSINMQEEIVQNIGLFFFYAKELDNSLKFYHSESKEFANHAIKMGTLLMKKGNLKEAENYLLSTEEMVVSTKDQAAVKLSLLDLYREKIDIPKHLKKMRELRVLKKEVEELARVDDFSYNLKLLIKEMQAILQRKPERKDLAYAIVENYDALMDFDPKERVTYLFYSGESLYGANLFAEALPYYHKSIMEAKETDLKMLNLSFESMLSVYKSLGTASEKGQELAPICEKYLTLAPNDTHSSYAYKKLFIEYHKNQNLAGVEDIIARYHKYLPQEVEFQRDMQSKYMTVLIEAKNVLKLKEWVTKIDQGFLTFETEYKTKIWNILGNILLNQSLSSKPSEENLALAQEIYAQPKFDSSIRIKASYNTAVAFLRLNQTANANDWLMKTLVLLPEEETKKLFGDFMGFLSGYFLNEDSQSLFTLSDYLITNYCSKDKMKMEELFLFSSQALMMATELKSLNSLRAKVQECHYPIEKLARLDSYFLQVAFEKRNMSSFETVYGWNQSVLEREYLTFLEKWSGEENSEAMALWEKIKKDTQFQKKDFFLSKAAEDKLLPLQERMKIVRTASFDHLVKNFDEAIFAEALQKVIAQIADAKAQVLEVAKLKNDKITVALLKDLSLTYSSLADTLMNFKPKIADENYRWSIRVTMKQMKKTLMAEEKTLSKKLKEFPADLVHENNSRKISSVDLVEHK